MGTFKTFQCNKCGYSAHISGGHDAGMLIKTNTMLCEHCKEVVDVVTEYWTKIKPLNSDIGICPACDSGEYLKEWDNKKRPCPRCDGAMEEDLEDWMTMWD